MYPRVTDAGSLGARGGDCRVGEGPSSGTSSVQTLALLSRDVGSWCSSDSGFDGGLSGFLTVGFRFGGISTTAGLLSIRTGIVGLRRGSLDVNFLGLGTLWIVRWGDLSWPPSGDLASTSVGRLIGPNGETPSCNFSQDPRLGALGGLAGFHGTVEVLISEAGGFKESLPVLGFGNNEATWELLAVCGAARV